MNHLLDNPVWSALTTKQAHFNKGNDIVKYFPANVAPFIGLQDWNESTVNELTDQIPAGRTFSMPLVKEIVLPSSFETILSLPLYQMYCPVLKPVTVPGQLIRTLGDADIPMMLELTALTRPGPFYERTIDFGNYMGIFHNDQLVSMAGDRMKTDGFTEISAICTHPDHVGKGYGAYLITKVAGRTVSEGDVPFLHVKRDNVAAIGLYKKMGFEIRAEVVYTIFKRR